MPSTATSGMQNFTGCIFPPFSDLPCTGHGSCVNGTVCVCDPGWSGLSHWFDGTGMVCVVDETTVLVLDWIAWVLMALLIVVLLGWFVHRGRPFLAFKSVPDTKRFTQRHPQEVMLLVLVSLAFMFAFQTLSLSGLRMVNSTGTTIVFAVLPVVWQLCTIATTGWQAYMSVYLLKGMRMDRSNATYIVAVLSAIGAVAVALWVACIIAIRVYGSYGPSALVEQVVISRVFFAGMIAETILHIIPFFLSLRFLRAVDALSAASGSSSYAQVMQLATQRLRTHMLGYLAGITYLIHVAVLIAPYALPYWISVMFIIGAPLCAMAFLLFRNMGATARALQDVPNSSSHSGSLQGAPPPAPPLDRDKE